MKKMQTRTQKTRPNPLNLQEHVLLGTPKQKKMFLERVHNLCPISDPSKKNGHKTVPPPKSQILVDHLTF